MVCNVFCRVLLFGNGFLERWSFINRLFLMVLLKIGGVCLSIIMLWRNWIGW